MPKLRFNRAIAIAAFSALAILIAVSASPAAMATTTAPSRLVSAHPITPHATGAMHPTGMKAAAATPDISYESSLQNVANDYCLNGTLAKVYMTPCNSSDAHMNWIATEYDLGGYLAYTLKNEENEYCLNGTLAKVYLTPCNADDNHMLWYPLGGGNGIDLYENAYNNGYCLNGYIGTAHAQVTITPCNANDNHMLWYNHFPF